MLEKQKQKYEGLEDQFNAGRQTILDRENQLDGLQETITSLKFDLDKFQAISERNIAKIREQDAKCVLLNAAIDTNSIRHKIELENLRSRLHNTKDANKASLEDLRTAELSRLQQLHRDFESQNMKATQKHEAEVEKLLARSKHDIEDANRRCDSQLSHLMRTLDAVQLELRKSTESSIQLVAENQDLKTGLHSSSKKSQHCNSIQCGEDIRNLRTIIDDLKQQLRSREYNAPPVHTNGEEKATVFSYIQETAELRSKNRALLESLQDNQRRSNQLAGDAEKQQSRLESSYSASMNAAKESMKDLETKVLNYEMRLSTIKEERDRLLQALESQTKADGILSRNSNDQAKEIESLKLLTFQREAELGDAVEAKEQLSQEVALLKLSDSEALLKIEHLQIKIKSLTISLDLLSAESAKISKLNMAQMLQISALEQEKSQSTTLIEETTMKNRTLLEKICKMENEKAILQRDAQLIQRELTSSQLNELSIIRESVSKLEIEKAVLRKEMQFRIFALQKSQDDLLNSKEIIKKLTKENQKAVKKISDALLSSKAVNENLRGIIKQGKVELMSKSDQNKELLYSLDSLKEDYISINACKTDLEIELASLRSVVHENAERSRAFEQKAAELTQAHEQAQTALGIIRVEFSDLTAIKQFSVHVASCLRCALVSISRIAEIVGYTNFCNSSSLKSVLADLKRTELATDLDQLHLPTANELEPVVTEVIRLKTSLEVLDNSKAAEQSRLVSAVTSLQGEIEDRKKLLKESECRVKHLSATFDQEKKKILLGWEESETKIADLMVEKSTLKKKLDFANSTIVAVEREKDELEKNFVVLYERLQRKTASHRTEVMVKSETVASLIQHRQQVSQDTCFQLINVQRKIKFLERKINGMRLLTAEQCRKLDNTLDLLRTSNQNGAGLAMELDKIRFKLKLTQAELTKTNTKEISLALLNDFTSRVSLVSGKVEGTNPPNTSFNNGLSVYINRAKDGVDESPIDGTTAVGEIPGDQVCMPASAKLSIFMKSLQGSAAI